MSAGARGELLDLFAPERDLAPDVPGVVRFFVAGIPESQGSLKAFVPKGWSRPVVTHDNPRLKRWRDLIAAVAQQHRPDCGLLSGPVAVRASFVWPWPKSTPRGRRPRWKATTPDLDRCTRGVGDALTGVLWGDDRQVCVWRVEKRYGETPGVDIEIVPLEDRVVRT
jgi:Holliday junction resolvase RusA-like endonuclease